MNHGTRDELLGRLADVIESETTAHPLRVAIDGRPAAGKTTLADELAVVPTTQEERAQVAQPGQQAA
jgi:uridine kinase